MAFPLGKAPENPSPVFRTCRVLFSKARQGGKGEPSVRDIGKSRAALRITERAEASVRHPAAAEEGEKFFPSQLEHWDPYPETKRVAPSRRSWGHVSSGILPSPLRLQGIRGMWKGSRPGLQQSSLQQGLPITTTIGNHDNGTIFIHDSIDAGGGVKKISRYSRTPIPTRVNCSCGQAPRSGLSERAEKDFSLRSRAQSALPCRVCHSMD